jgi:hypothetical protein
MFGGDQIWIQAYQFDGPPFSDSAPFPVPTDGAFGTCVDERDPATATWPFRPLTGASYLELPKADVSGPGITGTLALTKMAPATMIDWTSRTHDIVYGATGPATPDGMYTVDIGKNDPMPYAISDDYTAPLGIGGADRLAIDASTELEMTWQPPQSAGDSLRRRGFDFVVFEQPDASFAPQFMCFPDQAGHMIIPASVIAALPPSGAIFHIRETHYMEAREASGGVYRRFDLITSITNASYYDK